MTAGVVGRDEDWERFREYLNLLARTQVDRRLQGKLDLSGVVQQTLLDAHRSAGQLRGQADEQKAAWLRRILANNLADELRRLRAGKRDAARERSLEQAIDQSSSRIGSWLVAEQSSPSQQAMRHEESVGLAAALAELPDDQRRVIELHHFGGLSLAEVGAELGRTKAAVAGLLHRGLARLREILVSNKL
jgi:RNA polymerase sigma-70 factor (ECF subfamily)